MKYTGTVVKTISLLLVIGSLIFYQNIAQSRAEHNAAVRAQIKAEEKALREAEKKASAKYRDGVYEGEGFGFGGEIMVRVTITDGEIYTIDAYEHSGEDEEYFRLALGMVDEIIDANDPSVDVVTGSTFSSEGLLEAIKDALGKAAKK